MIAALVALSILPRAGTLLGRVTLAPLTAAERKGAHTHFDKNESVADYALQVFANRSYQGSPVKEFLLKPNGRFSLKLLPGTYYLTLFKDMNAGADVAYPKKEIHMRAGHIMSVKLILRCEFYE